MIDRLVVLLLCNVRPWLGMMGHESFNGKHLSKSDFVWIVFCKDILFKQMLLLAVSVMFYQINPYTNMNLISNSDVSRAVYHFGNIVL